MQRIYTGGLRDLSQRVPMPSASSTKDLFDFARVIERYAFTLPTPVAESDMVLQQHIITRVSCPFQIA